MLKKYFAILIFIVVLAGPALGAFNIPRTTFNISNLDKACQKAIAENKPITFLYSNKDTTCPRCTSASNDILYSLDRMSIIVYAHPNEWGKIPPLVQSALNSSSAGNLIPITVIVNPKIEEIIYILPYQRHNRIVLINEAKDKITQYFGARNWDVTN